MGAGYHGGFGYTFGSDKASKYSNTIESVHKNYTKKELLDFIDGVTDESSKIVSLIKSGDIKLSVLGDRMFEEYVGGEPGEVGIAKGKNVYLRASAVNIYSNLVHEGMHAYDSYNQVNDKVIQSWTGEYRAYMAEHRFQKAKGIKTEFANEDEIKVHIALNYKKRGRWS